MGRAQQWQYKLLRFLKPRQLTLPLIPPPHRQMSGPMGYPPSHPCTGSGQHTEFDPTHGHWPGVLSPTLCAGSGAIYWVRRSILSPGPCCWSWDHELGWIRCAESRTACQVRSACCLRLRSDMDFGAWSDPISWVGPSMQPWTQHMAPEPVGGPGLSTLDQTQCVASKLRTGSDPTQQAGLWAPSGTQGWQQVWLPSCCHLLT